MVTMRKKYKKIQSVMFLLMFPIVLMAQENISDLHEAIEVIKGKSLFHTKEWAIEKLRNVTNPQYAPQANNTLAIAYLNGIGVEIDSVEAIRLFEKAANAGYTNAYHNLGMLYKNAPYGRQDFGKSVFYFEQGATRGSLMCSYDAGYMYYKGIGCKQDYKKAISYFQCGLETSNPSCLYMLALCYRNGFGVERNEEKAKEYLRKSSVANYRPSLEEIIRDDPEVIAKSVQSENAIPDCMPGVEAFLNSGSELAGQYKGTLITYDWSGQQIVKEEKLSVIFQKNNDGYIGTWSQNTDTISLNIKMQSDGILKFLNAEIQQQDRYISSGKVRSIVEEANLSLLGTSLTGGLRMYSLTQREPERPMYVSLNRIETNRKTQVSPCDLSAYPIPSTGQIEVRFILPHDVIMSSITLITQQGQTVKQYDIGTLPAGKNRLVLSPSVTDGLYIVSLSADNISSQTAILLKR